MLGENVIRGCALTVAAVAVMTLGCDEDPISIGPEPTEMGMDDLGTDGPAPLPPDRGMDPPPPEPDAGECEPRAVFEPDPTYFAEQVAPLMYPPCILCHFDPAPRPGVPFTLVDTGPDGLSPEQNQLNIDECLAFVDADDPANSELIVWHPTGHPGYVPDGPLKTAIVNWIEAGSQIIEPEPGCDDPDPMPGPDVGVDPPDEGMPPPPVGPRPPCDALLGPDGNGGARSMQFRAEFEEPDFEGVTLNDLLIGSCANNGTCHAIAGEGGDYWLVPGTDECSIEWNFVTTQIYIDWLNPERSPLLARPTMDEHGGRNVYRGMDDARRGRLLTWIGDEIQRSR